MSLLTSTIKRIGALGGIDFQRIENTLFRARQRLFASRGTDLVIDVGANRGQYALRIREEGYSGRIISFEPIPEAFESLVKASATDPNWVPRQFALGQASSTLPFHVSENLASSSLLDVTSTSIDAFAGTRTVRSIDVEVRTLDEAIKAGEFGKRTHLKMDTQGSELDVLLGASRVLDQIDTVECELSFVPLYGGQPLFFTVCEYLYSLGFCAVWVERGFRNKDGELLQADALFRRDG
jgi:FkbM family methyltransferase